MLVLLCLLLLATPAYASRASQLKTAQKVIKQNVIDKSFTGGHYVFIGGEKIKINSIEALSLTRYLLLLEKEVE